jgi:hypothetical protein
MLSQRGGRAGRDKTIMAEVVLMAQESMFEDSREGQKRLLKTIKAEEAPAPGPSSKKPSQKATQLAAKKLVIPCKAKRSPREYTKAIIDFVNTLECRVQVFDKEFDNPARLDQDLPCQCDNCRRARGDQTLRERMASS